MFNGLHGASFNSIKSKGYFLSEKSNLAFRFFQGTFFSGCFFCNDACWSFNRKWNIYRNDYELDHHLKTYGYWYFGLSTERKKWPNDGKTKSIRKDLGSFIKTDEIWCAVRSSSSFSGSLVRFCFAHTHTLSYVKSSQTSLSFRFRFIERNVPWFWFQNSQYGHYSCSFFSAVHSFFLFYRIHCQYVLQLEKPTTSNV